MCTASAHGAGFSLRSYSLSAVSNPTKAADKDKYAVETQGSSSDATVYMSVIDGFNGCVDFCGDSGGGWQLLILRLLSHWQSNQQEFLQRKPRP